MANGNIDPTPATTYDGIHLLIGGPLLIWGPLLLLHSGWGWPLVVCVVYGILKEFIIDIHFESPAVSGMWWGGLRDFAGYIVGAGVANRAL